MSDTAKNEIAQLLILLFQWKIDLLKCIIIVKFKNHLISIKIQICSCFMTHKNYKET